MFFRSFNVIWKFTKKWVDFGQCVSKVRLTAGGSQIEMGAASDFIGIFYPGAMIMITWCRSQWARDRLC